MSAAPGPDPGPDPEVVAAAAAEWVWVPLSAERVETDEYLLVRYSDYFEHPLQLLRCTPKRSLDVVLDEVLSACRSSDRSEVCCWVPLGSPPGLDDALVARGGVLDETLDVLARPLSPDSLPALGAPASDDGVEVRWVEDLDAFRDATTVGAEVFGGSAPPEADLRRDLAYEVDPLHVGGGGTAVAYLDGEPVGSAGVTVVGSATGTVGRLWGGGVLARARSRGVYRALLDVRLRYAAEHGSDLALVKGRVQTSGPILRRAGFAAYGQQRSYVVPC